jgi:monoterpene epsilon-lactone hydrolase
MIEARETFVRIRREREGKPWPPLAVLRAGFAPGAKPFALPPDVAVTSTDCAGTPALWLDAPGVRPDRVVVFFHGGGYVMGSIETHGELAARVARAAGARALFLEYPLAPERPFPAAVDAAVAAVGSLAVPGPQLAFVGDSAGGGLAVAVLQALRDAGAPLPAVAAVISPLVDLTVSGASVTERADRDPMLGGAGIAAIAAAYLGGADPRSPRASPLFASLAGLPPLLVQVGSDEVLFSDAERLVQAARAAGVDATLDVGEGLFHVYQAVADAPEAVLATDRLGAFVRRSWS